MVPRIAPRLALPLCAFTLGCAAPKVDSAEPVAAARSRPAVPGRMEPDPVEVEIGGTSVALPRAVTSFGAAMTDDALYVVGGYVGRPHAYSSAGQVGDLLRYDLTRRAWTRVGEIEPAQSMALVAHRTGLVRVGGMHARNAEGTPEDLHSQTIVERFDPASGSWTPLPPLPAPRSSHDAVVIGDTLWVVGGWTLAGKAERTWHDTALSLDLSDPRAQWEAIDAPFRRRAIAAATVDGKLLVLGGMTPNAGPSTRVDVYDPASRTWSEGPPFAGPGFGMSAVGTKSDVIAAGMDGKVYGWRPGQEHWHAVDSLAFPRFFHRMVAQGDDVWVLGGIRSMRDGTRVRPIEVIAAADGTAEPLVLAYSLPSPLPSRNRQGVAVIADDLYLFGGNKSLGQHDFDPEFFVPDARSLDLATLSWSPMAPYPVARQTMSTFVTEWNQIVSIGGFGHDGEVARTHPEVYAYHPGRDEWREVGAMPGLGRSQFGLATHEDSVWVFGGLDYDPRRAEKDQFRHETPLLHAALKADEVGFARSDIELREPRRAFSGAVLGDEYFVVGGMREGFALVDRCEAFHFGTKRWRDIACPQRARLSAPMVALGGKLYVFGGSTKGEDGALLPDPSLQAYDPERDRWTVVAPSLPIEPRHVHMLTYGDRLLLVSTHNDEGRVDVALVRPPA